MSQKHRSLPNKGEPTPREALKYAIRRYERQRDIERGVEEILTGNDSCE